MAEAQLVFSGSEPVFLSKDNMIVGRNASCDIPVNESPVNGTYGVSRQHARLSYDGFGWMISDMGSVNGTRVNGIPLERERSVALSDGDVIEFGKRITATFRQSDESEFGESTALLDEEYGPEPGGGTVIMRDPFDSDRSSSKKPVVVSVAPPPQLLSLPEFFAGHGSVWQKRLLLGGAIVLYLSCAISLFVMVYTKNYYTLLDIVLLLPLAILTHLRINKLYAITLVVISGLELILSLLLSSHSGWLPVVGSVLMLTAILQAEKQYREYLSSNDRGI